MYDNGDGVPQDYAQTNLGLMYGKGEGEGVPQDYVQAYAGLSISAALGDKDATYNRNTAAIRMTPVKLRQARSWPRSCGRNTVRSSPMPCEAESG